MSYEYAKERKFVFTEEGQIKFLEIRDKINKLLKVAGAFRMDKVLGSGDAYQNTACVDRLVEIEEIQEIPTEGWWGQHRVFVKKDKC